MVIEILGWRSVKYARNPKDQCCVHLKVKLSKQSAPGRPKCQFPWKMEQRCRRGRQKWNHLHQGRLQAKLSTLVNGYPHLCYHDKFGHRSHLIVVWLCHTIRLANSELGHSGTPFPSHTLPPLPLLPLPPSLSPGAPPLNQQGGLGSAVSSRSGVWGKAPTDKRFGAYLSHKKIEIALLCFCDATAIRLSK